jgi:chromosome partitioning protein
MAHLLCVSNQKGGVGKTTVSINVAGALNELDHEVLLVDLDPQGSATEGLGFVSAYDVNPPSLFDVLTDPTQREAVGSLICEHPEMDVLPSNIDMTAVEPELTLARRACEQLSLALEPLEPDYDYIIVDCPPNLGLLTDNALFATRNVLIPALAESTSKRALELLFDHIESIELEFDVRVTERGVVANRVEPTNEADHMLEWLGDAFPDIPIWEVRKRVDLQRAFSEGGSIFEYKPNLDMAEVFLTVGESLEKQFAAADAEAAP